MDLKTFDWGREMLSSPSGTLIKYEWEGQNKLLKIFKNEEYGFISGVTVYESDINEDVLAMVKMLVLLCIIGAAVSVLVVVFFMSRRLKPLTNAAGMAERMANGNMSFSVEKKRKDETGQLLSAMEDMAEKLGVVVGTVRFSSDNVVSGSQQLSATAQQLSQGTTEQAAVW